MFTGVHMNKDDLMVYVFITLWIVLTAGTPDVLDGITHRLMNTNTEAASETD